MSEQAGRPRKDLSSAPHSISGQKKLEQEKKGYKVRFQDDHFSKFHGYNENFISKYKKEQSTKISLGIWIRIALFVIILLVLFFNIFGNTVFAQTALQDTTISNAPPISQPLDFQIPKRYSAEKADFDILVQELFPVPEEDVDYSDLYESLFQFFIQPLDLNRATRNELINTFLLSERQIEDFLKHREQYGKLLSIYEIQAIPSWDSNTIYRILPFVTITESTIQQDTRSLWQRVLAEDNKTLLIRYSRTLEEQKGYTESSTGASRYLGSPNRVYTRMRISHLNDFSFGFTLEKDAGEQFIWDEKTKRYGFDFLSAHAVLYNQGKFKAIAIGDYQLQIGQGLIMGAGFSAGKGSETINTIRRSTQGIRPYTSVLETAFQRGAAATYSTGQLDFTGYYSRVGEDGGASSLALDTLNDGQAEGEDLISSLVATGFHRTPNELAKKDNFTRQDMGGNITYRDKQNNLELGVTLAYTNYDRKLQRNDRLYNRFEFNGKENYNVGFNYSYAWRNMSFFGEAARSKSGGVGAVSGVIWSLARPLEMAMLFRHYDKNFHTFYGGGFGEGSRPINEQGFYWGMKYSPSKKWQVAAYYDYFRFPWMRFLVDAPSAGYEYLARLTFRPSRSIQLYGQFRQEVKDKNYTDNSDTPSNFNKILPYTRKNYQFTCDYKAEEIISLRAKIQFSSYEHGQAPTHGYVIVQDLNLDFGKIRFSTRFALFDTDDYNNRQYVYEKDVLYYFYIPAYYGRGFRNFYMIQLKAGKKIDIWAKWAYTKYRDQKAIGSGLEQINGDLRNDIRIQMRIKF